MLDVLNGTVSPSGKLPDTIARTPADYPAADHYGTDDRNFYAEDIMSATATLKHLRRKRCCILLASDFLTQNLIYSC